jgi:cellulose synthase (UDP-forming)
MDFYFSRFEDRRPPPPLAPSVPRELLWQFLAIVNLALGLWYLTWRWQHSLNFGALWFSVCLASAETLAYIGLVLFTINLWKVQDYPRRPPPVSFRDCGGDEDRPLSVDVFIATYNEDEELVRLSIEDARALAYPHPIDVRVHVLDDGRRPTMRAVAESLGVNYISRSNNIGFKAGNLRNAMEQTSGDFIVICDADTRVFPSMIANTLGYFRDPTVAFVQTPHWFYDIPEGERLRDVLGARLGGFGRVLGGGVERLFGEVRIGEDPYVNDSKMFFDIIQRRRNWANAAFCCGAASIHRREAVMFVALSEFAEQVEDKSFGRHAPISMRTISEEMAAQADPARAALKKWQAALEQEVTPYKFHVSEDIYSTIVLHRTESPRWRSVLHPPVESKMLSPQDLLTWTIQRFKYAGGSLDIFIHDNPVTKPGLSIPQRLMYLMTFWSYLGAVWSLVFMVAPIVFLTTGLSPVSAYSAVFFGHALPFLVVNELAFMVGTWGISGYKGKVSYLASFPISLRALWTVLQGKQIKFPVTPKLRQEGNFFRLVWPQAAMMLATVLAMAVGFYRYAQGDEQFTLSGMIANGCWAVYNLMALSSMVRAAFWSPPHEEEASA